MDFTEMFTDYLKFAKEDHTYEEWDRKFFVDSFYLSDYTVLPYQIFKLLTVDSWSDNLIPQEYELDLFLKCICVYCNIEDTYSRMLRILLKREPEEHKNQRISEVREALKDKIDSDGYVQAYRGVFERPTTIERFIRPQSFELKKALSFTLNEDTAYWFACRKKPDIAKVISLKVPLERILIYTNERNEQEIMVTPLLIKGKKFKDLIETVVMFDKEKMDRIDDMKGMGMSKEIKVG